MRVAETTSKTPRARNSRARWRAPLRWAWRAIDSTQRRIDASSRVIEASMRFAGARPVETSRRLQRVGGWIAEAADHLERAWRQVGQSTQVIELVPEGAQEAPALLVGASVRWLEVAKRLDGVSIRLAGASAWLVEQARSGSVLQGATPATVKRSTCRCWSIVIRRQRPAVDTALAAARRIFEARGPPSFDLPSCHCS